MKRYLSLLACFLITAVFTQQRLSYSDTGKHQQVLKVTTWDALGYYMYLPALTIYNDATELKWLQEIDNKYAVSGGYVYQASQLKNGNFVFKYLGGVAILQAPFFVIAHIIAGQTNYPQDGFSPPYQYAIAFGAIFYCLLGLFVLRKILLRYFSDLTVCLTLLLLALATNLIQYAAVDGGMSHAYIFPLYALVLYTTIRWHNRPSAIFAALTGFIIGLATICRPTEAVMLFIPLFWNTQNKEAAKQKWQTVKQYRSHLIFIILGGLVGVLPQLLYWKMATGSFVYDVGSKWDFANPHFRVLFGFEKGWFIYTPVTIFFIIGFFFIKNLPFRKSVLWFCLLNIYIVIAWSDWQYGGSYSTRALVQSYPIFALPLASFIQKMNTTKWKWLFYLMSIYLVAVNLFQIGQYNASILHFRDMNRKYYARIYLNPHPTPTDMSLLDSCEVPDNENDFHERLIAEHTNRITLNFAEADTFSYAQILNNTPFTFDNTQPIKEAWIRIDADINVSRGMWAAYLMTSLNTGHQQVRLFSPISKEGRTEHYMYYIKIKDPTANHTTGVFIKARYGFSGVVERVGVTALWR